MSFLDRFLPPPGAPGAVRHGAGCCRDVADQLQVLNNKGMIYPVTPGFPGVDPRVTRIRVMDPTPSTSRYPYPKGYVSYMNDDKQAVDPRTGQTISPSNPYWHLELR